MISFIKLHCPIKSATHKRRCLESAGCNRVTSLQGKHENEGIRYVVKKQSGFCFQCGYQNSR